jgi:hypothetical protein
MGQKHRLRLKRDVHEIFEVVGRGRFWLGWRR